MTNMIRVTIDLDLTKTIEVLSDYFNTEVPVEWLSELIMKHGQLLGEVYDGSIRDTYARDLLIEYIGEELPGYSGKTWPTYGTDAATSAEFFTWYKEAIEKIGGKFNDDWHR